MKAVTIEILLPTDMEDDDTVYAFQKLKELSEQGHGPNIEQLVMDTRTKKALDGLLYDASEDALDWEFVSVREE